MFQTTTCCVMGYLIGSLSPSAYVSKKKQHDLTTTGTGNLGATNTMLAFGLRYGMFVLLFDLLKAFAAVRLAVRFFPGAVHGGLLAGSSAVAGHIYPWQMKFKGGKGSACFAGVVLAFQPFLFPVLLVICIPLALLIDYAFVVPVSAVLLFPFMAAWRTKSLSVLFISLAMGLLIIYKHSENFLAVKSGTEGRFRTWFQEKFRNRSKH